jgi:hypothetical protein
VTLVVDPSGGGLDGGPPDLLPHGTLDGCAHESAPAARAGEPIDLDDQVVVELYVHSHV